MRSLGHSVQRVTKTGGSVRFRSKGLGGQRGNITESDPRGVNFRAPLILGFGYSVPGSQATSKGYLPLSMYRTEGMAGLFVSIILLS